MDRMDLEVLLDLVNRKIQRSSPTAAGYWRGFWCGIHVYFQPMMEPAVCDHSLLREIVFQGRNDPYLEAYARGYCDACQGRISPGF